MCRVYLVHISSHTPSLKFCHNIKLCKSHPYYHLVAPYSYFQAYFTHLCPLTSNLVVAVLLARNIKTTTIVVDYHCGSTVQGSSILRPQNIILSLRSLHSTVSSASVFIFIILNSNQKTKNGGGRGTRLSNPYIYGYKSSV